MTKIKLKFMMIVIDYIINTTNKTDLFREAKEFYVELENKLKEVD